MEQKILDVEKHDYSELINIWQDSVQFTHDFLPVEEINQLKLQILNKYFDAVILKCIKNSEGEILGFSGVAGNKLEMLFVASSAQGHGVGSLLCKYAIEHQGVTHVDVNEQNPRATEFYKKNGFKIVSRSELDGQGRPYPILHMERITP